MRIRFSPFLLAALALLLCASPAQAQFWDKVKDAAKRGAERAAERETAERADRAVTNVFEAGDDAVACVVGDDACVRQAQEEGREVVVVDRDGEPLPADAQPAAAPASPAPAASPAASPAAAPGDGVWANYDFVPGDRTLFYDDFARDRVGDFPRRLEFRNGSMEVVEWENGRALRAKTTGAFDVVLSETLPERFTLEFDYVASDFTNDFQIQIVDGAGEPLGRNYVQVDPYGGVGIESFERGGVSSVQEDRRLDTQMLPIRVAADGSYVKVYVGEERVANIPNADLGRSDRIRFALTDVREEPIYFSNLRVAAGGREILYDRLIADGRVATHGVLFDTGSDRIKPESTPTLDDIAETLRQYGDLRLRIEGHTDNAGSADANRQLSERRAAAVRDYLVQREGIDASRLESAGLGQTAPAADNATPEGRQTNRRVELVVL
ncbi:MAG: OmpA family protein [Rhodothermales bacterium]